MSSRTPLDVACIGGFGHAVHVFDEMLPALARLRGMAPAFPGEPLAAFAAHPLVARDEPRIFAGAEEMLATLAPDVVIVSTEPGRIAESVIRALRAGCHVIAEKPLACSQAELTGVADAWRESGRGLQTMLSMRALPAFVAARDAVRAGSIGEVVAVNARKSYKWGASRPEWFSDRSRYGGTFPWVGIHALDIVQFVTGCDFVDVAAFHANLAHPDHPGCEDVCTAALRLDNGALASISVDYFRPEAAPTHGDDWCRIVGTRGVLEANTSAGWCRVQPGGHDLPLPPAPAFHRSFLEAVRDGSPLPADPGFRLTAASLAARDAADSGTRVAVPA